MNCPGVYIHVGRMHDAVPFENGGYLGSAAAESSGTTSGVAGLIGVLKRAQCQHNSSESSSVLSVSTTTAFIASANNVQANERETRVAHYEMMYDENDTASDHLFILTSLVHLAELRAVIHHTCKDDDSKASAYQRLHGRQALARLFSRQCGSVCPDSAR